MPSVCSGPPVTVEEKILSGAYKPLTEVKDIGLRGSRKAVAQWHAERAKKKAEGLQLLEEFKRDLFEEYGVSDNPKRDLVWEQAVSSGHNFLEVAEAFKHLVPLIT